MKSFFGTCIGNPFRSTEKLDRIIDNAKPISKAQFLRSCDVDDTTKHDIRRFPRDYTFYQSGGVMFYEWSRIEHFYR